MSATDSSSGKHDGKVGFDIRELIPEHFGDLPPVHVARIGWQYVPIACEDAEVEMYWTLRYSLAQSRWTRLGFSIVRSGGGLDYDGVWPQTAPYVWTGDFRQVIAPDWAVIALTTVLPLVRLYHPLRRRR